MPETNTETHTETNTETIDRCPGVPPIRVMPRPCSGAGVTSCARITGISNCAAPDVTSPGRWSCGSGFEAGVGRS